MLTRKAGIRRGVLVCLNGINRRDHRLAQHTSGPDANLDPLPPGLLGGVAPDPVRPVMLPVMIDATGGALEQPVRLRAVVLVEGLSDRIALEAVASRRGRSLSAEGVSVVDMGGATNVGRFLERFGPPGLDVALTGLYDAAEEPDFRRALERVGLGSELSRADMERLGFFACEEDLEDELIRAIGADAVLGVIRTRGELGPFRTLSKQPEWRERPVEGRLRRFLGNSYRKTEYAPLLVAALDLSKVPRPLDGVLSHV